MGSAFTEKREKNEKEESVLSMKKPCGWTGSLPLGETGGQRPGAFLGKLWFPFACPYYTGEILKKSKNNKNKLRTNCEKNMKRPCACDDRLPLWTTAESCRA